MIAIRTKISVNRFAQDKIPVIQNMQKDLNTLGEEGWELVSVQNVRLETGSLYTVAYLKRQKQ